jgi:hypothetical protein
MTAAANRQDTGAAVAGLFARPSATGGLAGRNEAAAAVADGGARQQPAASPHTSCVTRMRWNSLERVCR